MRGETAPFVQLATSGTAKKCILRRENGGSRGSSLTGTSANRALVLVKQRFLRFLDVKIAILSRGVVKTSFLLTPFWGANGDPGAPRGSRVAGEGPYCLKWRFRAALRGGPRIPWGGQDSSKTALERCFFYSFRKSGNQTLSFNSPKAEIVLPC